MLCAILKRGRPLRAEFLNALYLSAPAQRMLTLAAIAGQCFDFALLQELPGLDEAALLPLLKEVVAAHLVEEEWFAFRHPLTRQATRCAWPADSLAAALSAPSRHLPGGRRVPHMKLPQPRTFVVPGTRRSFPASC